VLISVAGDVVRGFVRRGQFLKIYLMRGIVERRVQICYGGCVGVVIIQMGVLTIVDNVWDGWLVGVIVTARGV